VKKKEWVSPRLVSIQRPWGYEPPTLPLRHEASEAYKGTTCISFPEQNFIFQPVQGSETCR
jgi:hypothetical protein